MIKAWTDAAWSDYMYWHNQNDKATIKRINRLIENTDRHPFEGIGKPEPLKYELTNVWARRITQEHRLLYQIDDNTIYILAAKDHY
ncbi:Txe/YoeB family addiction module toxin [Lactobacillus sp. ESL0791]|uniref:Txe/YoeB family addiction module toxin n=1 Tax=Lactobacillus sp. ESL0791 TaxID=2983234 RepID=UPI0023F63ACB|nr:Txe/YoeB family addiction module toxin [Lactobacillus sp. ESL0791]MDF7639210.1 Txe/YoeB family addiction module toxin [Lactobacillus sp. ESL0791]